MLGHKTSEMLFEVYARYIPNRTRRDGSAFAVQMASSAPCRNPVLIPKGPRRGVNANPTAELGKGGAEGGT